MVGILERVENMKPKNWWQKIIYASLIGLTTGVGACIAVAIIASGILLGELCHIHRYPILGHVICFATYFILMFVVVLIYRHRKYK